MVAAARAQLAALQAPGPFVLVALSLGGMVAAQWAQDAPHEVAGCVLVNSSLGAFSPFWDRLRPGRWPLLLRCLLPGTSHRQRERTLYRITSAHPLDDAVIEQWVAFARTQPVAPGNFVRQLLAAARFRAPARCPVAALVLSSARDRLVSPRCSQAIAAHWRLPHRVHPDAGHDLPLDDPDWVAGAIADWHAAMAEARAPAPVA
jgi:pimeloyl-ACP methyl ester carboxylesterase